MVKWRHIHPLSFLETHLHYSLYTVFYLIIRVYAVLKESIPYQ